MAVCISEPSRNDRRATQILAAVAATAWGWRGAVVQPHDRDDIDAYVIQTIFLKEYDLSPEVDKYELPVRIHLLRRRGHLALLARRKAMPVEQVPEAASSVDDPARQAGMMELVEHLAVAIQEGRILTEKQRICVMMRLGWTTGQGASPREIAIALSLGLETVKSHLNDGFRRLREWGVRHGFGVD